MHPRARLVVILSSLVLTVCAALTWGAAQGATGRATAPQAAGRPGDAGAAAVPCTVDYRVQNQWDTGFTASVTVTNNGAAKSSWAVKWSYAGNQKVTNAWNAKIAQSGAHVTAADESYNGALGTGSSVSFCFQGTYSDSNAVPAAFTLDGVTCNVDSGDTGTGRQPERLARLRE